MSSFKVKGQIYGWGHCVSHTQLMFKRPQNCFFQLIKKFIWTTSYVLTLISFLVLHTVSYFLLCIFCCHALQCHRQFYLFQIVNPSRAQYFQWHDQRMYPCIAFLWYQTQLISCQKLPMSFYVAIKVWTAIKSWNVIISDWLFILNIFFWHSVENYRFKFVALGSTMFLKFSHQYKINISNS